MSFWVCITRSEAKRHATSIPPENKEEICWKWRRWIWTAFETSATRYKFVKTLVSLSKSYYLLLANNVQLHDVDCFCCKQNGVLSLDTTFNLCKNWITNSCYYNQRLQNSDGQHPVFLGPSIIHFQKDALIFFKVGLRNVLFLTKN